ncbi:MAG: hypothetical protein WA323_14820 [Candidatus Nitrosopolaris sp.]
MARNEQEEVCDICGTTIRKAETCVFIEKRFMMCDNRVDIKYSLDDIWLLQNTLPQRYNNKRYIIQPSVFPPERYKEYKDISTFEIWAHALTNSS